MTTPLLYTYVNGNYQVRIHADGTKSRESDASVLIPDFPESIDLKITNRCDHMCPYCHEMSHSQGEHAHLSSILDYVSKLPAGVELAIGGGNIFEYPYLSRMLLELNAQGFICNTTVASPHLKNKLFRAQLIQYLVSGLIKGLGISYNGIIHDDLPSSNTVYHVIAGITSFEDMMTLVKNGHKILILGYKQHGRGAVHYNSDILNQIKYLQASLWKLFVHNKNIISFDNLAIEQLNVKHHLTASEWQKFYMGDDGKFTMYVDAVTETFAKSSIAEKQAATSAAVDFKMFHK